MQSVKRHLSKFHVNSIISAKWSFSVLSDAAFINFQNNGILDSKAHPLLIQCQQGWELVK